MVCKILINSNIHHFPVFCLILLYYWIFGFLIFHFLKNSFLIFVQGIKFNFPFIQFKLFFKINLNLNLLLFFYLKLFQFKIIEL